jgi:hypothetical protein
MHDVVSATSVADPTKYTQASVEIANSTGWTGLNQQPVGMEFYPNSVWTTPLPTKGSFAVQNHLLSNSDAIVENIFANSDTPSGNIPSVTDTTAGGDTACNKLPFYYSDSSKPIYLISVTNSNLPTQPANNANGVFFHLYPGAQASCGNASPADHGFHDWDQSLDIDRTAGGRILSLYFGTGASNGIATPNSCTCTTVQCASTTAACQITAEYADYDYPFNDPLGGIGDGAAWNSMNTGSGTAMTRWQEVCGWNGSSCAGGGTIAHAMTADVACTAGVSFPSIGGGTLDCATGDPSVGTDTNAPANGALFWIDSAYNCNALPSWQKPVCVAAQTYGYYIRDTSGGSYAGTYLMNFESQQAWHDAGNPDPTPFLSWLSKQPLSSLISCSGSPVNRCNINFLVGMPGLISGDAGNSFKPHLHVVDPCVPRSIAGQSATCTGSPGD